eukprot:2392882-Rhodomonas_salina.2
MTEGQGRNIVETRPNGTVGEGEDCRRPRTRSLARIERAGVMHTGISRETVWVSMNFEVSNSSPSRTKIDASAILCGGGGGKSKGSEWDTGGVEKCCEGDEGGGWREEEGWMRSE